MRVIYHRLYLLGYGGSLLSRAIRRLIARRELHRAWLAGHMLIYLENGTRYGVCDREFFCFRKGPKAAVELGLFRLVCKLAFD